jgi:glycerophosphoryl diester phosphodiesterase
MPSEPTRGVQVSNAIIRQRGDFPQVADNVWHINAGAGAFLAGALAGAATVAAVNRAISSQHPRPRPSAPRGWPTAFIHRGGAGVVPEDTIEGFQEGLRHGDAVLECDVHATIDGELVVMHDVLVDRTTDRTGPINQMTYAEVQQLDAGYRFTTDNGVTYSWRGRGVKVPTLAQVYEKFPDQPINVEIKKGGRADIESRVAEAIAAAGAESRTIVVSQSRATMQRFREASEHRVATGASMVELVVWWLLSLLHLTRLLNPPYQALQAPQSYRGLPVVTPAFVRAAHRQGLRVDVWTIDEEADMRRLLSYGVDGIMTDRPDVLARVFAAQDASA